MFYYHSCFPHDSGVDGHSDDDDVVVDDEQQVDSLENDAKHAERDDHHRDGESTALPSSHGAHSLGTENR
jgi:hypothetical protein